MNNSFHKSFASLISLLLVFLWSGNAQAHSVLSDNLRNLVTQAGGLDGQIAQINLTAEDTCGGIQAAHRSALDLLANLENQNAVLAPPITLDQNILQALDDLSQVVTSMANRTTGLSVSLGLLDATADKLLISSSMTAMLRLSDDIGVMADRILEMADKILVMADNIGIMADRIIQTQLIQSENLAQTQSFLLITQQNIIALASPVNTITYTVDIDAATLAGNLLAGDISTTLLTPFNMANQWGSLASDVDGLRMQVDTLYQTISADARSNTTVIDPGSYATLAEMSIMVSSIGIAMQGLALATEGLQSVTRDSTLDLSMDGVLSISADIGVMADRILEMADLILAMADNIGLVADQIIATQQLQSANYAASLSSIEATQTIAIGIIVANGF
ncbi:MAG: hypothetical protein ABFS24_08220 [Pseudomonadota bacterium]